MPQFPKTLPKRLDSLFQSGKVSMQLVDLVSGDDVLRISLVVLATYATAAVNGFDKNDIPGTKVHSADCVVDSAPIHRLFRHERHYGGDLASLSLSRGLGADEIGHGQLRPLIHCVDVVLGIGEIRSQVVFRPGIVHGGAGRGVRPTWVCYQL